MKVTVTETEDTTKVNISNPVKDLLDLCNDTAIQITKMDVSGWLITFSTHGVLFLYITELYIEAILLSLLTLSFLTIRVISLLIAILNVVKRA